MPLMIAFACVFVAAFCQTATGFGFALVLVPLLALSWELKETIALSLLVAPLASLPAALELRRATRWPVVAAVTAGSLCGVPVGAAVLEWASAVTLRAVTAGVVLLSTGATAAGLALPQPRRPLPVALAVGVVSGILRSATSMGGPPLVLYLLGLRYPVRAFVATNATCFLLGSMLSIAALSGTGRITPDLLRIALSCLPALAAGTVLGRLLRARLSERAFRLLAVGVLFVTASAILLPLLLALLPLPR